METVLKLFDDHFDGEGGRWHYQIGSTPCRKFGFPMLSCCVAPAGTSRGHDSWCFFLSHVGTRTPKTLGFTENIIKTFWCLVSREFSGMIHWLWIIIPATHPATPTFSTSKKMDDDWGYPRDLGNLQNPPNNYYTWYYPAGSRQSIF